MFNNDHSCFSEALEYIDTHLLADFSNACEVYYYVIQNFDCLSDPWVPEDPGTPEVTPDPWVGGTPNNNPPEEPPYDESQRMPIWWYHSDHLGSSSYITDNFGRPSHYYEYLPFGELMTEHNQSKYYLEPYPTQNMDSYNNPYKFNGKEMDKETGMYYYGARYYDPRISIFVSVDPLAEEFVGWTPYHYVHQNPINLIDPTGMAAEPPPGTGYRQGYTSTDEDGVTWKLEGKVWQNLNGGEDQWQDETLSELVINVDKKSEGVGQPGALESAIPIWGSGRAAVDHFQNGNYWRGTAYTALAISDVFLIKAIATGVAKGGAVALGKNYKNWSSYRKMYGNEGFAKPGQHLHHWALRRNGAKSGEGFNWWFKNQMWNLKPMKSPAFHTSVHGKGANAFNGIERAYYGSPIWFKASTTSTAGHSVLLGETISNEEE